MGALVAITKWSKAINLTNEQQALGAETVASLPAFWQWALTRWRHPALEHELLATQDNHGAVVMELLLVAWLAEIGVVITDADVSALKAAGGPWVEGVVIPLREQRKQWAEDSSMQGFRQAIKPLELDAERILATLLWQVVTERQLLVATAPATHEEPAIGGSGSGRELMVVEKERLRHNIETALSFLPGPVALGLVRNVVGSFMAAAGTAASQD